MGEKMFHRSNFKLDCNFRGIDKTSLPYLALATDSELGGLLNFYHFYSRQLEFHQKLNYGFC